MVKNVFIRLLVGCVLLFVVCTSKAFGQENIKRIKDNYRSMLISRLSYYSWGFNNLP